MSKDTLTEKLVKAYEADDYTSAKDLMGGLLSGKNAGSIYGCRKN